MEVIRAEGRHSSPAHVAAMLVHLVYLLPSFSVYPQDGGTLVGNPPMGSWFHGPLTGIYRRQFVGPVHRTMSSIGVFFSATRALGRRLEGALRLWPSAD